MTEYLIFMGGLALLSFLVFLNELDRMGPPPWDKELPELPQLPNDSPVNRVVRSKLLP